MWPSPSDSTLFWLLRVSVLLAFFFFLLFFFGELLFVDGAKVSQVMVGADDSRRDLAVLTKMLIAGSLCAARDPITSTSSPRIKLNLASRSASRLVLG